MTRFFIALLAAVCFLLSPRAARAHEIDSASLSLTEVTQGRFALRFRSSSTSLQNELSAPARFPRQCRLEDATLDCGRQGLVGVIEFPWLSGTLTKVMVDIQWQSGARLLRVVAPSSPRLAVYGISASAGLAALQPILVDYGVLGVEHILTGFDHLLFVIALALLVVGWRRLVATVTAFTLAHSVSLAATVLGWLSLPSAPVEASIALSIVLVCAECLREGPSLTKRAPWLVAFAFGLLHGLGFASALLEIGVPEQHVPTALVGFNLGVELGQLGVIAAFLVGRYAAKRLQLQRATLRRAVVYAMGTMAAFWLFERIPAIFTQ